MGMGLLIQAVTEKPIPGGQSEADSIAAMDSSSHSTSAEPVHAVPAAKGRDRGAAVTSSPSAWYAAPQQPRDIRAILRCVHPLMHLPWRSTCISHDFPECAFYNGLMSAGVSASQWHFNQHCTGLHAGRAVMTLLEASSEHKIPLTISCKICSTCGTG